MNPSHADRSLNLTPKPFRPWAWGWVAGIATFVLRIPFLFRYDLHFGGDSATCYLMSRHILLGARPTYFFGQDYMGPLDQYLSAILFRFFGPSIPLAGAVTLAEWSLCIGLGVALSVRLVEPKKAPLLALFVAIGVPYTLHYTTVPMHYALAILFPMLLAPVMLRIIDKGGSFILWTTAGLICGLGWYMNKQCLPGLAAAALTLAWTTQDSWNPKRLRLSSGFGFASGFLVGYLPEILYRISHPHVRSLLGLAGWRLLLHNCWAIFLSWGAYFDAQPVSRMPESVYFFLNDISKDLFPDGPLDILFFLAGLGVAVGITSSFWRSFREKDPLPMFLSSWVVLNVAMVALGTTTDGAFLSARRYLFSCSIALSIWTGLLLLRGLSNPRWVKPIACLAILFLARSLTHQYVLLGQKDELREFRTILAQCQKAGYNGGIGHWGHAYFLDALSDERFIVAGMDVERLPEYAEQVGSMDRMIWVGPIQGPLQEDLLFGTHRFKKDGPEHPIERFRWVPYRAVSK